MSSTTFHMDHPLNLFFPSLSQWSYKKLTSPDMDFDDLVNQAKTGSLHGSSTDQGMKLVAEPDHSRFEAYGKVLGDWEKMEEEVIRVCAAQE